ncbi:hypothetical protein [Halarcobacter sp.]|uniref:hypothetical protein n=1 Tax=Halarcobacter sp. TaxID=2321133 RepID=UPI002AAA6810|nr:hypothetical protein [Halarcobacter sp.]
MTKINKVIFLIEDILLYLIISFYKILLPKISFIYKSTIYLVTVICSIFSYEINERLEIDSIIKEERKIKKKIFDIKSNIIKENKSFHKKYKYFMFFLLLQFLFLKLYDLTYLFKNFTLYINLLNYSFSFIYSFFFLIIIYSTLKVSLSKNFLYKRRLILLVTSYFITILFFAYIYLLLDLSLSQKIYKGFDIIPAINDSIKIITTVRWIDVEKNNFYFLFAQALETFIGIVITVFGIGIILKDSDKNDKKIIKVYKERLAR